MCLKSINEVNYLLEKTSNFLKVLNNSKVTLARKRCQNLLVVNEKLSKTVENLSRIIRNFQCQYWHWKCKLNCYSLTVKTILNLCTPFYAKKQKNLFSASSNDGYIIWDLNRLFSHISTIIQITLLPVSLKRFSHGHINFDD